MDRKGARLFLAGVPAVAAAMRVSSGFRGLGWPALFALHVLSLRDGISIEQLAAHMGADASSLSTELTALRKSGHVRETGCSGHPERCAAAEEHRSCGRHHLQWLTESGREVAEDWSQPFVRILSSTDRQLWLRMAARFRSVSLTLKRQPAKRGRVAAAGREARRAA